jgi:hypothetical protein
MTARRYGSQGRLAIWAADSLLEGGEVVALL